MSSGAQQAGTTTNTQTPPPYMYPYIGTALGQAGNLLEAGGPKYYPGQQVASFNPAQQAAMGGTLNLDQGLMQGNGNPYENQMFTQAAQAVQPQLASQFAGSGRDIVGSEPLASQQLNNLATNFYGNNYQNTIQNALGASNQALGIGNQIQNQSQALIDASKNAYTYNQQQPYSNLQQYESFLSGVQPGQQTQSPYFTNPTANTLGGLLAAGSIYKDFAGGGGAASAAAK